MAKQTIAKTEILSISFNFDIRHKDPSVEGVEDSNFRDNVHVDFKDDQGMNRILTEKPYLKEVIPILVDKMNKEFDANNASAAELKSKLSGILSA